MADKQKNVPYRRFKEFENADAWEQRKLGDLTESFEYGLNASAKVYDGINKYVRITDIDDETHTFKMNSVTSPDTDLKFAGKYRLKKGDILFARTGASVGKTYCYRESDGFVYYAGFLVRARIKPQFNYKFVFQNTLTETYKKFIRVTSQRSGQPGVNAKEYSSLKIMVPRIEEQSKIGNFLSKIDHLITLHQRKYDKLKKLKSAYLTEMFPAEGERKPKRRFSGFTDDWEQRKLGDIVPITMGQSPNSINYTDNPQDQILVQGNADMKEGYVVPRVWTTQITKMADKGDLILSVRAPVGDIGKTNYDVVLGRGVAGIKGNSFIFQQLGMMKLNGYWNRYSTGSTFESINSKDLKTSVINIPSKEEQTKIGKFFDNIDHLITLHQQQLEKLKNLKQAYLNEMFV
ncbi:restriction endonuclease subunit S [Ligilactobacillus acidipiscis]|uniref:restriction endonuclease subunit S n=1 Tax=Ligilactobacillus acidipiscis TaxID=89059 RepID=UPI0022E7F598|nr:restriction endonuclease subunit S [Ligilactobacillus acidipiscis]